MGVKGLKERGFPVRTFADLGTGSWIPGMPTIKVNAWVLQEDGIAFLGLERVSGPVYQNVVPGAGSSALVFQSADIRSVRKVASGLNTVVEFDGKDANGWSPLTIIGPRGRIKKLFKFLGFEL